MGFAFKVPALLLLSTSASLLSGCDGKAALGASSKPVTETAAAGSPYQPTATIQDIMDSLVDPSSDYLWDSVATEIDAKGIREKQPRTDADWHEFRRRAILLAEAANLLTVPGRRAADNGKTVENGEPLDTLHIKQRLDANHGQLVGFAGALREVAVKLAKVAQTRDVGAINTLGGELDSACESCHRVFWYPDEVKAGKQ